MAEDIYKTLFNKSTSSSDTKSVVELEESLTNNKMVNFSYTQDAYTKNNAAGVDTYVFAQDQNIPLGDSAHTDTAQTVLNKGFRAQAASLPRMLLNHLLGRASYNLNKINDLFYTFLEKFKVHMTQNPCVYSPTAIYNADDMCFVVDENDRKRTFLCIYSEPISNFPPLIDVTDSKGNVTETVNTKYWKEVGVSSVNGYEGAVTLKGSDIGATSPDYDENLQEKISTVQDFINTKGKINGLATLNEEGRLPYSQLPESSIEYKGTWNASTNTPTLKNGDTGNTNGDFYVVSVAGTWNGIEFTVNDRIICTGTGTASVFSKLEGGSVNSVNDIAPINGDVDITGDNIPVSKTDTTAISSYITGYQIKPIKTTEAGYKEYVNEGKVDGKFFIIEDSDITPTAGINDNTTASDTAWSSSKTDSVITNRLASYVKTSSVVDSVTDGNLNPVTSNAVNDALANYKKFVSFSIEQGKTFNTGIQTNAGLGGKLIIALGSFHWSVGLYTGSAVALITCPLNNSSKENLRINYLSDTADLGDRYLSAFTTFDVDSNGYLTVTNKTPQATWSIFSN